ncbi:MAG: M3 family metallopeptidase, partial [Clostridiaceae bacterium]
MDRDLRQDETEITTRDIARSARKLLRARFGTLLKRFYLRAGLALLVLATAGAFLAAAVLRPDLLGSVRGEYRADMLLIFCGVPAILLAALYAAYLHPRAVIAVYESYAQALFVAPRGGGSLGKTPNRSYARAKGAYWAAALVWLGGGLLAVGVCWPLSIAAEKIPKLGFLLSSVVLTLGTVLFWQLRVPLGLSLAAAVRENIGGFRALRRGFLLHRRVRNPASSVLMPWLIVVVLTGVGALLGSLRLADGEALKQGVILAFLFALTLPVWSVLFAAMDTALYAAACRGRRLEAAQNNCLPMMETENDDTAHTDGLPDSNIKNDRRKERISMKTRDQIENNLKWELSGIYESEDLWEQDFASAQELVGAFSAHAGKLHASADALYAALTDGSKLSYLVEKLYIYAHLKKDEDNGNVRYQGMTDRAIQLLVSAEAASSFVKPEILAIPHETLVSWSKQDRFANFRFDLFDIDRRREHTLSTEEERLLAMAEDALSGADNIFRMLSDVDLDYGTVTDENGEEVKLTHGTYGMFLMSPDRRVRRDAYEGLYKAYRGMKNTITATYATSVKADVFRARTHNFSGALEAALFGNGVPVLVYDQLIEAVHEKLPTLRKYLDIRKRVLGVDQLEMYDLYVPILSDCDIPMPYEDAKSLVREAL